jgi:hypothetical protein
MIYDIHIDIYMPEDLICTEEETGIEAPRQGAPRGRRLVRASS